VQFGKKQSFSTSSGLSDGSARLMATPPSHTRTWQSPSTGSGFTISPSSLLVATQTWSRHATILHSPAGAQWLVCVQAKHWPLSQCGPGVVQATEGPGSPF
jgi:hypothetical protein